MKKNILCFLTLISLGVRAQKIQFLDLPSFFDREFEISGLTGNEDELFLGAERCGKIFVIKKADMSHVRTIHLALDSIGEGIEIEGLSNYKDMLLLTDEKNGKLYGLNLKTDDLKEIKPIGKDLSSFQGAYGMEGIATDEASGTVYILRERNEKNQSEIHTFAISETEGSLQLDYKNERLIQHENEKWRYTGLAVDAQNKRLLCLKSYYEKEEPTLSRREIEYLELGSLATSKKDPILLVSLTKEIYFLRDSFATNVEGIYADHDSIFVTSDNGEGVKECSQKSTKTPMIRVQMN